jgi:hypothetical protein
MYFFYVSDCMSSFFEFFSGSQCTQWKTLPDSHATLPPPVGVGRWVGFLALILKLCFISEVCFWSPSSSILPPPLPPHLFFSLPPPSESLLPPPYVSRHPLPPQGRSVAQPASRAVTSTPPPLLPPPPPPPPPPRAYSNHIALLLRRSEL